MNRYSRSWHWLALAGLVSLAPLGAGCDITPEPEPEFQFDGVLSQATVDTTTTDHVGPAPSPDGTRILFITDAYAEAKNAEAATDYAVVTLPPPGSMPPSVDRVGLNSGWAVIDLGDFPNDSGSLFSTTEVIKGEATWMPDSQGVVAVVHNNDGNERLYRFDLDPVDPDLAEITVSNVELIDDVDYSSVGNRNSYHYLTPSVSPNGEWLAYARYYFRAGDPLANRPDDAEYMAIFAYNFSTGQVVRVTNGSTIEQDPTWSPSGSEIIFTAQAGAVGTRDLMKVSFDPGQDADVREWIPPEDGGQTAPFTDGRIRLTVTAGTADWKVPVGSFNACWMRDGRVVFTSTRRAPGESIRVRNLWVMDSSGGNVQLALFTRVDESDASTANFTNATSDAASLVVFTTRDNRADDFYDQKQDLWVMRDF